MRGEPWSIRTWLRILQRWPSSGLSNPTMTIPSRIRFPNVLHPPPTGFCPLASRNFWYTDMVPWRSRAISRNKAKTRTAYARFDKSMGLDRSWRPQWQRKRKSGSDIPVRRLVRRRNLLVRIAAPIEKIWRIIVIRLIVKGRHDYRKSYCHRCVELPSRRQPR